MTKFVEVSLRPVRERPPARFYLRVMEETRRALVGVRVEADGTDAVPPETHEINLEAAWYDPFGVSSGQVQSDGKRCLPGP